MLTPLTHCFGKAKDSVVRQLGAWWYCSGKTLSRAPSSMRSLHPVPPVVGCQGRLRLLQRSSLLCDTRLLPRNARFRKEGAHEHTRFLICHGYLNFDTR